MTSTLLHKVAKSVGKNFLISSSQEQSYTLYVLNIIKCTLSPSHVWLRCPSLQK